jgi:hypothetical protein
MPHANSTALRIQIVFVIITACEICKLANSNDDLRRAAKQFLNQARRRFLEPKIILKLEEFTDGISCPGIGRRNVFEAAAERIVTANLGVVDPKR